MQCLGSVAPGTLRQSQVGGTRDASGVSWGEGTSSPLLEQCTQSLDSHSSGICISSWDLWSLPDALPSESPSVVLREKMGNSISEPHL